MNRVLVFWLAVLLVFTGSMALIMIWRMGGEEPLVIQPVGGQYLEVPEDDQQKWMQDFTLIRRTNEPFRSSDLQGKVWVASFFFASCPTVCRTQNERIKLLHADFSGDGVTFVGITCDPQNDSPAVLQDYANQFTNDGQQWFFLTGNFDYIRRVAAEKFQFPLGPKTHSERFAVVDKWGNVRGAFHWNKAEEWLAMRREIKRLATESEEPAEWIEKKAQLQRSLDSVQESNDQDNDMTTEETEQPSKPVAP
ncbi:MAG: SCO family protein [Pirellulaceae bacterium]